MTDSRSANYTRSNRLQGALSKDDDLWEIYFKQETDAADAYIRERLAQAASPLAVLQGVVGAAAQLAGMGSKDELEADVRADLHDTFETGCRSFSGERGNPDIPYDLWKELVIPEFSAALKHLDYRVSEGGASYAILSGMIAAAARLAGDIVHATSVYDMRPSLHATIETLFDGGCEIKLEMREVPSII